MNAISNWDEVPMFDREEAEAAYWAENRIDVRLMEGDDFRRTQLVRDAIESASVSVEWKRRSGWVGV